MAAQNRIIDSLIQVKDPRLEKDKDGNFIRPNRVTPSGKPLYYETYHGRSHRKAIKADVVGTGGRAGYNLTGTGVHIGVWDGGHVFAAHDEFTGGPDYFDPSLSIEISDADVAAIWSSHPTSVTSIMVAKGLAHKDTYDITGIAPGVAKIYSYDWDNDLFEIFEQLQLRANPDFILSNHSYGYPLVDNNNETIPNQYIGDYSDWSALLDEFAYVYPTYLHVLAAGNDGRESYPDQQVLGLDQLTGSTSAKKRKETAVDRKASMCSIKPISGSSRKRNTTINRSKVLVNFRRPKSYSPSKKDRKRVLYLYAYNCGISTTNSVVLTGGLNGGNSKKSVHAATKRSNHMSISGKSKKLCLNAKDCSGVNLPKSSGA